MDLQKDIKKLVTYGLDKKLIMPEDEIYTINQYLEVFRLDEYEDPDIEGEEIILPEILDRLTDTAYWGRFHPIAMWCGSIEKKPLQSWQTVTQKASTTSAAIKQGLLRRFWYLEDLSRKKDVQRIRACLRNTLFQEETL